MGELTSAKIAAAPGQKPSSRLRNRLASATRSATRSSRARTRARSALISSEQGCSGRKRWPSVRRMSASMKASPGSLLPPAAR